MPQKDASIKHINTLSKDSGTVRETKKLRGNAGKLQSAEGGCGASGEEKAGEWPKPNCSIPKPYNLRNSGSCVLKNHSSSKHEQQRQGKD